MGERGRGGGSEGKGKVRESATGAPERPRTKKPETLGGAGRGGEREEAQE